jgi:hypothetical protein
LTSINAIRQNNIILSSYPNPAKETIYFITSTENEFDTPLTITIYNSVGKKFNSFILTSGQHQWGCGNLSQGTYIYTLSSGNKVIGTNKFQIIK